MKLRLLPFCLVPLLMSVAGCERTRARAVPKAVAVREDGALELRVMSFNIRYENSGDLESRSWSKRVIGAVKMIRREQPDIIGVQEALHGQAADLWASLPDYEFFGVGRDDGAIAGEYSGIFYRRDRFHLDQQDHGTFWLSDTPETPGSRTWGNEIPRIAAWVRLVDLATGRGFYAFNTHWDHKNQPSRERSAVLMAQRIDLRKREEPVVLIGDFNSVESNPGLVYLLGVQATVAGTARTWAHGLFDTYQTLHATEKNRRTLHFWSDSHAGLLKVDHILVSRGAKIQAADIVTIDQPMVSDHFPVTAHVTFPGTR